MAEQEQKREREGETYYRPEPKEPEKLPDFTSLAPPKRADPFRLADFRGSGAYQKPT